MRCAVYVELGIFIDARKNNFAAAVNDSVVAVKPSVANVYPSLSLLLS